MDRGREVGINGVSVGIGVLGDGAGDRVPLAGPEQTRDVFLQGTLSRMIIKTS
jgi:hypothetical protein